ncbi:MAG: pyridoxamine kinase [Clostridia bacterium]|nr:pyridoxamine kinase [Clostridia bacterium]
MFQTRVMSIQDISCFGKCSLTVALPIMSAMGAETCIIPTAILSTHTGGFTGFTYRDLTDDIPKIADHWESIGLKFNAISTGYLGSFEQIAIVKDIFAKFGDGAIKFVDPVMADNGKLYTGFTPEFAREMAKLCAQADIIVPNMTEACFMLGMEYKEGPYSEEYIKDILKKLTGLGCKVAAMTGVVLDSAQDKQGVIAYDSEKDEFCSYYNENLPVKFHGTGDIFASTMCGALALGRDLEYSIRVAVDYTVECIKKSIGDDEHKYGVRFEECIGYLTEYLKGE